MKRRLAPFGCFLKTVGPSCRRVCSVLGFVLPWDQRPPAATTMETARSSSSARKRDFIAVGSFSQWMNRGPIAAQLSKVLNEAFIPVQARRVKLLSFCLDDGLYPEALNLDLRPPRTLHGQRFSWIFLTHICPVVPHRLVSGWSFRR